VNETPVIYLVDDDPAVLRALSRLLRAHGMPIRTFQSGTDFLSVVPQSRPDCVLFDVQMPEISGFNLRAKMQALGCKAPVIYITAHENPETEQLALSSQAVAFLYKPIRGEILCAAIRTALGQSRDNS
jgi:FixJ family two-component response regulator